MSTKMKNQTEQEYSEKLKIKIELEKNLYQKIDGSSLKSFERINKYLKGMSYFFDRNLIKGHLDFESIASLIAQKKNFKVISGRNPSAPLHLGHLALFRLLLELQKLGATIFIPFTNDESFIDGKVDSFESGLKTAYETIPYLIALGFDPEKTKVLVHTEYLDIYKLGMYFGSHVNTNQLKSLFGEGSINTPSKVFYRGAVQLASILMLQLEEFGGSQNTLVPVSLDQHPYVLLTRDVANKVKMTPP
ncbi:hypothetical protein GF389_03635, partial [Candidatus Dojkabacteria bacterium]|nr:hypothetical protein [Candidatus Dojkabacteria bacterium]